MHLVRLSLRFTSKKYWGPVCRELREIYTAPTVDAAEGTLRRVRRALAGPLPGDDRHVGTAWDEFVPFLEFPVELRKIVYTTNAIESSTPGSERPCVTGALPHRTGGAKGALPRRHRRRPNRANLIGKINGWKQILNALTIHYGDRVAAVQ